jgi:hypothetical protein
MEGAGHEGDGSNEGYRVAAGFNEGLTSGFIRFCGLIRRQAISAYQNHMSSNGWWNSGIPPPLQGLAWNYPPLSIYREVWGNLGGEIGGLG